MSIDTKPSTVPAAKVKAVDLSRRAPVWALSRTGAARRLAAGIWEQRRYFKPAGWVAAGYWSLGRRWLDGYRFDYPQMIATARADVKAARGDMVKEAKAKAVRNHYRAEYQAHKKRYLTTTAVTGTAAAVGTGVAIGVGGPWVALLLALATVAFGAWNGRPRAQDPGGVLAVKADGAPFPIADARNRTEAAECVRRALESEGISAASVEANQHHQWGWEVTVRLARGKPGDIISKAADLETPLDLPEDGLLCQPMRASRGRVVLRLVQSDPFVQMPEAPEREPNSCRMRDKQLVAYRMDGQPFSVSLLGLHVIVVADSGGGKSVILRTLADALTACSDVLVGDLDPGGNGLSPLADALGVRAVGLDAMGQIEKILEQALRIARARPNLFAELGMKENWEPTPGRPAIVLFLDEYPQLSDRAKELAVKILQVGRKSRVQLVIAAQKATADSLGEAIAESVSLKIMGPCRHQDIRQVFGVGKGADGWRPDRLHPAEGEAIGEDLRDASKAYVMGAGSSEPLIFKFLFLDIREATRRGKERAAAGRPTVDARSLKAAGLEHFGATEADRLREDLPKIVMMIRGAYAVHDDPTFLSTGAVYDYLAANDPDTWALEQFGEDEIKARRLAVQRVSSELKRAVADMHLGVDVSTRQITSGPDRGARGWHLGTIQEITGEIVDGA